MKNNELMRHILDEYLEIYPDEAKELDRLKNLTDRNDDIFSRKNMVGHCTSGAIVVDVETRSVLMLDHAILHRLLPPGGHIAENENPLEAAYREMQEETSITKDMVEYRAVFPSMSLIPFDIDVHRIPENRKKNEGDHYHYDLRYLFLVRNVQVEINEKESNDFRWLSWNDFTSQHGFLKMATKMEALLDAKSPLRFYDKVMGIRNNINYDDYRCIVIEHILPSTYDFLVFLHAKFKNFKLFAKPKSKDERIIDKLSNRGISVKDAKRNADINYYFGDDLNTPTVIIDIGGYFTEIAQSANLPIVGIVEDTENGYQKYDRIRKNLKYPVLSVARSPLKDNEDRLVGEAVVHGADTLLRLENVIIDYCKVAIIGYGKVGAGIAGMLLKRNIQPSVVESNPMRLVSAVNNYCLATNLTDALMNNKVIFCATGSKIFDIQNLRKIRNGAYLVSVTSSDDEFDLNELKQEYQETVISDKIKKYSNEINYFYLLNEGNAVNFLYGAALSSFVYLVMAEMLACTVSLIEGNKEDKRPALDPSPDIDRDTIAKCWLAEFTPYENLKG